jgi:hypothetical protein
MGAEEQAAWRERRRHAIIEHAAEQERQLAGETARAGELIAAFAREAAGRRLRVTALKALGYNGRGRYRTGLRGWYIHPNRTIAVGVDGQYYLLAVPDSLRARLTGAVPQPAQPRLVIGRGAADGQSIPLETLLRQRLAAGDDWP